MRFIDEQRHVRIGKEMETEDRKIIEEGDSRDMKVEKLGP